MTQMAADTQKPDEQTYAVIGAAMAETQRVGWDEERTPT
jgi:hypothetical protein